MRKIELFLLGRHILVKMHHREKMSDQCSQGEKHTKMTLILIKKLFQKTDILMVKLAYLGLEASNLKKDAGFGFSGSRNVPK